MLAPWTSSGSIAYFPPLSSTDLFLFNNFLMSNKKRREKNGLITLVTLRVELQLIQLAGLIFLRLNLFIRTESYRPFAWSRLLQRISNHPFDDLYWSEWVHEQRWCKNQFCNR